MPQDLLNLFIVIGVVVTFVIAALLRSIFILKNKNKNLEADIKNQAQSNDYKDFVNHRLEEKILKLSKFQVCVDAEAKAQEILQLAESNAQATGRLAARKLQEATDLQSQATIEYDRMISEAKKDADNIVFSAKAEASSLLSEAKRKKQMNLQQSEDSLNDAIAKAKSIIAEAEENARNIAGEAYDLSKNIDEYKETLASIKNVIKGYGLSYIKPLDSVLDDLAENYGFTEAGKELVQARNYTRLLIENNEAASCEYVETNRRDTAIAFILDAFNGKVDSILSLIKKDNYGVLEQKIKDAYAIVNLLGKPFRNAHITSQYLEARLAELKWGAAVIAIKLKEKEEQRLIKERIREEEKARREYEKAIRDAEKQEKAIRKAIEKATAQLEKSNEEQKKKYEAQLLELQAQLSEAEAKNQRALSMAQQTRSGHVYIISNIGSFGEDVFKIGMTRRLEPLDRVRELGDASVPFPFDVHAMIFSEDAPTLETELHKYFSIYQVNKVNPRKEFFKLPLFQIKSYLDEKNIEIKWTILAEAAQYRETKALEEAFKNNANIESDWIKSQETDYNINNDYDDVEYE